MKSLRDRVNTEVVVANLGKRTEKTFRELATIKAIRSQAEFDRAGELVKSLKVVMGIAKEEQRRITDPLNEALERTYDHFRPFYAKVNEAETTVKLAMSVFLEGNKTKIKELEDDVASGKIKNISTFVNKVAKFTVENNSATIRKIWKAEIQDERKIPRKFLMPDSNKIVEHLKKGGAPIPGVVWHQVDSIAI